jgi:hypothetical protein
VEAASSQPAPVLEKNACIRRGKAERKNVGSPPTGLELTVGSRHRLSTPTSESLFPSLSLSHHSPSTADEPCNIVAPPSVRRKIKLQRKHEARTGRVSTITAGTNSAPVHGLRVGNTSPGIHRIQQWARGKTHWHHSSGVCPPPMAERFGKWNHPLWYTSSPRLTVG